MSMTKGSVSIDSEDASVSGSGLAREFFDDFLPKTDISSIDDIEAGDDPGQIPEATKTEMLVKAKQGVADLANSIAKVIVDHIVNNAEVETTISTSDDGLQVDADTSNPTNAPATEKTLTNSGTIS